MAFNVGIDININSGALRDAAAVRGRRRRNGGSNVLYNYIGAADTNNIGVATNPGNGFSDSSVHVNLTGLGLTAASQINSMRCGTTPTRARRASSSRRHGRHGDQPAVHLWLRGAGTDRGRWFAGHVTSGRFLSLVAASEAQGRLIRLNFAHENGEPL